MNNNDIVADELLAELIAAFDSAINSVGIDNFRLCSFFARNERE